MEHVLRDKNENVSSGQQSFPAKNDIENLSPENLKENHNPKSLLEIASDTTSKFQMNASTPKTSKKTGSFRDVSFDINFKGNESFTHEPVVQNSSGLSFLMQGFGNLNLKEEGDETVSDEEEQFLSFNDLSSNRTDDQKITPDIDRNDVTLVLETNERPIQKCYDEVSSPLEVIKTPDSNQSTEIKIEESPKLSEINKTFENVVSPTATKEDDVKIEKDHTTEGFVEPLIHQCESSEAKIIENTEGGPKAAPLNEQQEKIEEQKQNLNDSAPTENSPSNASANVTQILNYNHETSSAESISEHSKHNDVSTKSPLKFDQLPETIDTVNPATDTQGHLQNYSEDISMASFNEIQDKSFKDIQIQQLSQSEQLNVTYDENIPVHNIKISDDATFSEVQDDPAGLSTDFDSQPIAINNATFEALKLNATFETRPKSPEQNFMESFQPSLDIEFKMPSAPISRKSADRNDPFSKETFTSAISYNFGDSDFDFLQKVGSNNFDHQNIGRDSVLLKFDPLLAKPVPIAANFPKVIEEDEHLNPFKEEVKQKETATDTTNLPPINEFPQLIPFDKDMNVEIMKDIASENDKQISNLDCEDVKLSSIEHHENKDNNNKLMELENKMRMEAEQREEVLLKRISEKDKQISKMNNVVKEYEKAIAELIAEKEQLVQSYEKKCADLKNDSEMNAQHLASLESTFSDLHAKYERTKQIASDLKEREEQTLQDRKTLTDNLKMQEARYDKMKMHAMSQLEIANKNIADMLRNHQAEVTKLKAQLKKEEISRASINEQLLQKSKENAELVKICDELIGNHGNSNAV